MSHRPNAGRAHAARVLLEQPTMGGAGGAQRLRRASSSPAGTSSVIEPAPVSMSTVSPSSTKARLPPTARLGTHVSDAQTSGGPGESPVGYQSHLLAQALSVDQCRHAQHLSHSGAAARTFISNDHHHSQAVSPAVSALRARFFAFIDLRLAGETLDPQPATLTSGLPDRDFPSARPTP